MNIQFFHKIKCELDNVDDNLVFWWMITNFYIYTKYLPHFTRIVSFQNGFFYWCVGINKCRMNKNMDALRLARCLVGEIFLFHVLHVMKLHHECCDWLEDWKALASFFFCILLVNLFIFYLLIHGHLVIIFWMFLYWTTYF